MLLIDILFYYTNEYILKVGEGKVSQCISGFTALDISPLRGTLR